MSVKRTILVETALVFAVLTTGIFAANVAYAAPSSSAAQGAVDPRANVKIDSEVLVERVEQDANGNVITKLLAPSAVKVTPGDKLVFVNAYRNDGSDPVTGFVINNPIHPSVTFTEVSESWSVVSVDGGKTFGKLVDLTVAVTLDTAGSDGEATEAGSPAREMAVTTRAALPSDVTHIRWVFADPIPGGGSGKLEFRGVVK